MGTKTYYVEVTDSYARNDFVPFSTVRKLLPGSFISARCYGPYTERGARQVLNRALDIPGTVHELYGKHGGIYVTYTEDGVAYARVAKIHSYLPGDWVGSTTRNMPS